MQDTIAAIWQFGSSLNFSKENESQAFLYK